MAELVGAFGVPHMPNAPLAARGCGHPSAAHAGQHVDYLVDGHAHHAHEGHWDECEVQSVFHA